MDRVVRLEAKPQGQQNNGSQPKGFEPVWTGPAGKKDENQVAETDKGRQVVATGRTTWTTRYQSGVKPTMRLVDITNAGDEVVYNIEGVKEVGRREALELVTSRINT